MSTIVEENSLFSSSSAFLLFTAMLCYSFYITSTFAHIITVNHRQCTFPHTCTEQMYTSIHIHTHSSHSCIVGLFCAAAEPAFSVLIMSASILNLYLLRNVLLPNKTAFTKAGGVAAQIVFMLCRWQTAIQVPFCMSLHSCLLLQKQGRCLWT